MFKPYRYACAGTWASEPLAGVIGTEMGLSRYAGTLLSYSCRLAPASCLQILSG